MSRNYDNWERLVAAVIKREEDWQLCHQISVRTFSICSEASSMSGFSSSFRSIDGIFQKDDEEFAQKPLRKLNSLRGFSRGNILGKGRFGTSYFTQLYRDIPQVSGRDLLAEGDRLVMKKLKSKVKVKENEFKIAFGNIRHKNVAAPRAYYFSIKGNFLFNDYHSRGSVYDLLHEKRGNLPKWKSRLKIAVGAARGIAHIHRQCDGELVHGNVRSSNIFLNSEQYGCVSDYGLAAVMRMSGEAGALDYHASGYEFKNASHESDVYSFGVVLLELITGKSPMEPQGSSNDLHIVEWARSVRPEDWSSNLYDTRLLGNKLFADELDAIGIPLDSMMELEMEEMMKVAMSCLARLPHDRPKMIEVVFMLESIADYGKIVNELKSSNLKVQTCREV